MSYWVTMISISAIFMVRRWCSRCSPHRSIQTASSIHTIYNVSISTTSILKFNCDTKLNKKHLKIKHERFFSNIYYESKFLVKKALKKLTKDVFVTNVFVSMRSPVFPSLVGTGFRFRSKVS